MPFVIGTFVVIGLILLFTGLFTVKQQTAAVIQRFGKFQRDRHAGPELQGADRRHVAGRINLRVQQLDVGVETKTEDNVFVKVVVAVQYYVLPEKVYDAFYKLADPRPQITAYVFDVVRARVPQDQARRRVREEGRDRRSP